MAEPVIIENRPRRAWAFVLVWLVELLAGLGFVASGWRWLGAGENGAAAVLIAMGLILLGAGIVMVAQSFRIARLKGAAVRLSDTGLTDRRISEHEIPWQALRWRLVYNGRSYAVHFSVTAGERKRLSPYWEQALIGRFHRLFGYPDFAMATLGTGLGAASLSDIMRKYRAED